MEQLLLIAHFISLAAMWYKGTHVDFEFAQALSPAISLTITGRMTLEMLFNILSHSFIFCKMGGGGTTTAPNSCLKA